jgi:DNA-binding NtrC family response regulator
MAEQISVLSKTEHIDAEALAQFLPKPSDQNRSLMTGSTPVGEFANEREILYKLFFDMKKDVNELKKMFFEILQNPTIAQQNHGFSREAILSELKEDLVPSNMQTNNLPAPLPVIQNQPVIIDNDIPTHYEIDESLNIMDKEKELILKALKKHKGRRKDASTDLGISERTLYRKIKEYDIEE